MQGVRCCEEPLSPPAGRLVPLRLQIGPSLGDGKADQLQATVGLTSVTSIGHRQLRSALPFAKMAQMGNVCCLGILRAQSCPLQSVFLPIYIVCSPPNLSCLYSYTISVSRLLSQAQD